jgi:hypothetical protein
MKLKVPNFLKLAHFETKIKVGTYFFTTYLPTYLPTYSLTHPHLASIPKQIVSPQF